MSIEKELQRFISSDIVPGGVDRGVGMEEPLVSSGEVDSMGLLQILGFIDQHYGVDLMSSGNPKDFDTILAMAAAVRRVRGEH
jgi:acyl carrier protein